MNESENIRNYSAADMEKYWKGQLTPAEMYAMEKAAMDDPFLADAMEGFKNITSSESDILVLKQRLEERTETKIFSIGRRRFTWFRVAAAIIILTGVGLLAQQLFYSNSKNEMAKLEKENVSPVQKTEPNSTVTITDSSGINTNTPKNEIVKSKEATNKPEKLIKSGFI